MIRESHLATIEPTTIGTSKITGTVIDFGKSFTTGDLEKPHTIAESVYPVRYNGLKFRVMFPKNYTGTMTVELKSGTESGSLATIATYTVGADITGEHFEAGVPENAKRYMSLDVTPSVAMSTGKVYGEFVPNV